MNPSSAVWAEIDLAALRHNAHILSKIAAPAELMAVVKANAYGHGLREIVQFLSGEGIRWFGVARFEEAAIVRQAAPAAKILCLLPLLAHQIGQAIDLQCTITISDIEMARAVSLEATRRDAFVDIHLEVDTGMGRSGTLPEQACDLLTEIANLAGLRLSGLMTHLSCAESDTCRSTVQLYGFEGLITQLGVNNEGVVLHTVNSAGTLLYASGRYQLVRAGIALYGFSPGGIADEAAANLRPALSLKAHVLSVRELPAGHTISYGATYTCSRTSRIATLGIGYGDGYSRSLSNRASVLLQGQRAPIIGAICMDVLMVDVTEIPNVSTGDVATLIGTDGGETITIGEIARIIETTPHEILTSLGQRIERVYLP